MGLDVNGAKFLLYARQHGVSFSKTAMIGRQGMLLTATQLAANLELFGIRSSKDEAEKLIAGSDGFAEGFLESLGAGEVDSFDVSTYENASIVHDLNEPVPDEFKNKYSVVLDGGTLEHVFNYPVALKSCMEMVADGGHFLAITPANNQMGHGFYQFSPELFFRVFCDANGFELVQVMIYEETPDAPWYDVSDPDAVNERVTLVNGVSSMLLLIAKKIKTVDIFRKMPHQSDYVSLWTGETEKASNAKEAKFGGLPMRGIIRAPLTAFRKLKTGIQRSFGMLEKRPRHFKKVDLP